MEKTGEICSRAAGEKVTKKQQVRVSLKKERYT